MTPKPSLRIDLPTYSPSREEPSLRSNYCEHNTPRRECELCGPSLSSDVKSMQADEVWQAIKVNQEWAETRGMQVDEHLVELEQTVSEVWECGVGYAERLAVIEERLETLERNVATAERYLAELLAEWEERELAREPQPLPREELD